MKSNRIQPVILFVSVFLALPPLVEAQTDDLTPVPRSEGRQVGSLGKPRRFAFEPHPSAPPPSQSNRELNLKQDQENGVEEIDDQGDEAANVSPHETIRQRYPDGRVQVLRHVMQDEDGDYFNQGPWKLFNRRGQVMAEGEFDQGTMHGPWRRWHASNSDGIFRTPPFNRFQGPYLSNASFNHGQLHGAWTIHDQMQRKIFEMNYEEGVRHGAARWWHPNGTLMRGNDIRQGETPRGTRRIQ